MQGIVGFMAAMVLVIWLQLRTRFTPWPWAGVIGALVLAIGLRQC